MALLAGVAQSTVSRAFTNPGRVSPSTRQEIFAAAERLGYKRDQTARTVASGRTNTLALLVPDITNPYFAGVIKGAARAATVAGMSLVLGDTQENPVLEEQLVRRLSPTVDGFVLSAARMPDSALQRVAKENRIALINRSAPGIPCVVHDYDAGTRQIVDHLASLGHTSFAFLGGPPESWSCARRWAGLKAAAAGHGLTATRFGPYSPSLTGGPAAADAALAASATAVVAHNDMLAIGVIHRLQERHVDVPSEISVVGFDNMFGADFLTPGLTTLAELREDAGARCIELLSAGARLGVPTDGPSWVLPTQLVVRASTGPAPA